MFFRSFEHNQVYHPGRTLAAGARDLNRPCEDVFFEASDGVKLNAWFFPAETNSPRKHLALLFCHGNGGNISHRLDVYEALLETGIAVLALDYRGYGLSGGRPSEEGTYRDAQAAHAWLRQKGFAGTNVISYGESLGGAIASELCRRETTGGLILQSTFTSIPDIGAELYPWLPVRLFSRIRYDTHRRLPQLRIPVLILHSREDNLVGYRHSESNFAVANEPKLFCELQGGHNDPLADRRGFIAAIEKLLGLMEGSGQQLQTNPPLLPPL
ncbi:MAG: alpha/beta hydrolase [Akkermansiaceae bacterium]|nr:alpha/beta hydrolase [Verrucomicrobiales bacterium]